MSNIRDLEKELKEEIAKIRIDTYEIRDRTVRFKDEVRRYHKSRVVPLFKYLRQAQLKHVLTAPVIWWKNSIAFSVVILVVSSRSLLRWLPEQNSIGVQ